MCDYCELHEFNYDPEWEESKRQLRQELKHDLEWGVLAAIIFTFGVFVFIGFIAVIFWP